MPGALKECRSKSARIVTMNGKAVCWSQYENPKEELDTYSVAYNPNSNCL